MCSPGCGNMRPQAQAAARFRPASPESGRTPDRVQGLRRVPPWSVGARRSQHPLRLSPTSPRPCGTSVPHRISAQTAPARGDAPAWWATWSPRSSSRNGATRRTAGGCFAKKRCSLCHDNPSSGAPGRSATVGKNRTRSEWWPPCWKHGPAMLLSMRQRNVPWPPIHGRGLADISAYLYGLELRRRTSP